MYARALVVAAVLLGSAVLVGTSFAAPPYGLDQRPTNLSCVAGERPQQATAFTVETVFTKVPFARPISMVQPRGDSTRWFLAERTGIITTFPNDSATSQSSVALDISDLLKFTAPNISDSQQWGITAIDLHPNFPTTPYLYVASNRKLTAVGPIFSIVSRFTANADHISFDPTSEKVLLALEQKSQWHHLGQIAFGPDGYLYMGDGVTNSWFTRAQDPHSLYGKILRVDVNGGDPYGIPADNPFADGVDGAPEVYALGFRNPWRFTFDRLTGELWLGDVGTADWEEVDKVVNGGNYGWPIVEGTECFNLDTNAPDPTLNCDTTGLIEPVYQFPHLDPSNAVIGGYVYRGSSLPALQGTYLFGGKTGRMVSALTFDPSGNAVAEDLFYMPPAEGPSSFAEGNDGELYVINQKSTSLYKIVAATPSAPAADSTVAALLSETGCVDPADPTKPAEGLIPYTVNMPLWSDGAEKGRWLALPEGTFITITDDDDLDFPIGTVLMKTFLFQGRPFETRLFMLHSDGVWAGYSYEWRDDLSDADLLTGTKTKAVEYEPGSTVSWTYPSGDQCLHCHTGVAEFALGPEINQLNGNYTYPSTGRKANQLSTLEHIGLFAQGLPAPPAELPALARRSDGSASIVRLARSYLHANCAHCHQPDGPTPAAVDLRFATNLEDMNLCDEPPSQGSFGIPGAALLLPDDTDKSIVSVRMHTRGLAQMPPLATVLVDPDGTSFIDDWIDMSGVCDLVPDSDGDGTMDNADNCVLHANVDQRDSNEDAFGNACDADFNGNGKTNSADVKMFKRNFGKPVANSNYKRSFDLNSDDVIDRSDYRLLKRMYREAPGPSCCDTAE